MIFYYLTSFYQYLFGFHGIQINFVSKVESSTNNLNRSSLASDVQRLSRNSFEGEEFYY